MDDLERASITTDLLNSSAVQKCLAKVAAANAPKSASSGICIDCDDAIEPERLGANPTVERCHFCASEREAAQRRARRCGA